MNNFKVLEDFKLFRTKMGAKLDDGSPSDNPILGEYYAPHIYTVTDINREAVTEAVKLEKAMFV
jgi:hypothetical protein